MRKAFTGLTYADLLPDRVTKLTVKDGSGATMEIHDHLPYPKPGSKWTGFTELPTLGGRWTGTTTFTIKRNATVADLKA